MTANTVVNHNIAAGFGNLNWFVEVLEREALGMAVAVLGLDKVLSHYRVVRHMAVITSRPGMMGRTRPAVIFIVHDVTVGAGLGIIRKIRGRVGIAGGVGGSGYKRAKKSTDYQYANHASRTDSNFGSHI